MTLPGVPLRSGGPAARIAVIPGDGIGPEVTPQAVKVLKAVAAPAKLAIEFVEFDWSADKYLREGVSLPPGAVEMLRDEFDAILFGALGDPRVPSNQHAADILLGLRFKLDLYVNARPVELLHDRLTPLRDRTEKDIRLMVFRENTEGLYVGRAWPCAIGKHSPGQDFTVRAGARLGAEYCWKGNRQPTGLGSHFGDDAGIPRLEAGSCGPTCRRAGGFARELRYAGPWRQ